MASDDYAFVNTTDDPGYEPPSEARLMEARRAVEAEQEYSQGIMSDGPVILRDGQPMTPEEIVEELNSYHRDLRQATNDSCCGAVERVKALVAAQAKDDGIWFDAATCPEAHLQAQLRELHAAIEAEFGAT